MRIIAGFLGGRQFEAPRGHRTHPMSDKMRGALFNALGDIGGLTVLDAFGGSGALSFEAISRGAASAVCIEIDKNALSTIKENIQLFGLDESVKAIRANVSGWSDNNPNNKFDLVLCDPPYEELKLQQIQKLVRHVKAGGLLILSWPGKLIASELTKLKLIKHLDFGDSQLIFYRFMA